MARKKTHAEYVAEVNALDNGIEVVGEYVNKRTAITHRCAKWHEWDAMPNHILRGTGCPTCNKKKTHAEYVAQVEALDNGIAVVGKYEHGKKNLTHRCAEGHEFDARPNNILFGRGCPKCRAQRLAKNHAEYVAEVDALGKGFEVVGEYLNAITKIAHRCAEEHEFEVTPKHILEGWGCPHCEKKASDANVFYIWENADDPGVYKVGITSERCAEKRIAICTGKNKMTANIIVMAAVDDARDIERRALELGDDPHYPATLDGYTEFRRYSDAELGAVYQMAVQAA